MIVGRVIGWILVVAGIAILVRDIIAWIDTGTLAFIATGELWFTLNSFSLNFLRYLFPELWDPIFVSLLLWPAFLVVVVPGLILSYAFRRRPRLNRKSG